MNQKNLFPQQPGNFIEGAVQGSEPPRPRVSLAEQYPPRADRPEHYSVWEGGTIVHVSESAAEIADYLKSGYSTDTTVRAGYDGEILARCETRTLDKQFTGGTIDLRDMAFADGFKCDLVAEGRHPEDPSRALADVQEPVAAAVEDRPQVDTPTLREDMTADEVQVVNNASEAQQRPVIEPAREARPQPRGGEFLRELPTRQPRADQALAAHPLTKIPTRESGSEPLRELPQRAARTTEPAPSRDEPEPARQAAPIAERPEAPKEAFTPNAAQMAALEEQGAAVREYMIQWREQMGIAADPLRSGQSEEAHFTMLDDKHRQLMETVTADVNAAMQEGKMPDTLAVAQKHGERLYQELQETVENHVSPDVQHASTTTALERDPGQRLEHDTAYLMERATREVKAGKEPTAEMQAWHVVVRERDAGRDWVPAYIKAMAQTPERPDGPPRGLEAVQASLAKRQAKVGIGNESKALRAMIEAAKTVQRETDSRQYAKEQVAAVQVDALDAVSRVIALRAARQAAQPDSTPHIDAISRTAQHPAMALQAVQAQSVNEHGLSRT